MNILEKMFELKTSEYKAKCYSEMLKAIAITHMGVSEQKVFRYALDNKIASYKRGLNDAFELLVTEGLISLVQPSKSQIVESQQEQVKYVDSREVAKVVGKEHKELLRDIRKYEQYLNESKVAPVDSRELGELNFEVSEETEKIAQRNFALSEFFVHSSYKDSTGRELPCYLITRKGCELIAHKMTGAKGVQFSAWYINKFHEMKDYIEGRQTELNKLPTKIKSSEIKGKPKGMLTATEVGKYFGASRQAVARRTIKHNLKTDEYGVWENTIAPNGRPVRTFYYYPKVIEALRPYFTPDILDLLTEK